MKLGDWLKRDKKSVGKTSGNRINKSYREHQRFLQGLPDQRKICLIDYDGKKGYYEIDIQRNGNPVPEVKTVEYLEDKRICKEYKFWKEQEDYLLYIEY